MALIGYWIVALVGYGLALLALAFAYLGLSDALRMLRAGVDIDGDGHQRKFHYAMVLGCLVVAAVLALLTNWALGSF